MPSCSCIKVVAVSPCHPGQLVSSQDAGVRSGSPDCLVREARCGRSPEHESPRSKWHLVRSHHRLQSKITQKVKAARHGSIMSEEATAHCHGRDRVLHPRPWPQRSLSSATTIHAKPSSVHSQRLTHNCADAFTAATVILQLSLLKHILINGTHNNDAHASKYFSTTPTLQNTSLVAQAAGKSQVSKKPYKMNQIQY